MTRKNRLWTIAIPCIALSSGAFAKTDSCGTAKIVSGKSCADMTVEFDVSHCERTGSQTKSLTGKPECTTDGGQVTVKSTDYRYRAKIAKSKAEGGWGDEVSWKLIGEVRRKELTAPPSAKSAKSEKKNRNTAEQTASPPPKSQMAEKGTPAAGAAVAKPEVTQTPVPAPTPAAAPAPIAFSGFVDFNYGYNFNRPAAVAAPSASGAASNQNIPQSNTNLRFYDLYHNDLGLNLVEFTLKKSSDQVNFIMDLDFGLIADQNASSSVITGPGTANTVDEVSKHVGQAVISYTPAGTPRLTLEAGKMVTHIGYEVYKSRDNWQYSRSFVYSLGLPVWHVGAHAAYTLVPDKLVASLYLYNGDNTLYETNSSKSYGFQAKWTPSADISLLVNTLAGPPNANNNGDWRFRQEANLTWTASESLAVALEMLYGMQKKAVNAVDTATWGGATLHAKWNLTPKWYLSPRLEVYRDVGGFTSNAAPGTNQTLREMTLTYGRQIAQGLDIRGEGRWDIASQGSPFLSNNGARNSQITGSAAILYSF